MAFSKFCSAGAIRQRRAIVFFSSIVFCVCMAYLYIFGVHRPYESSPRDQSPPHAIPQPSPQSIEDNFPRALAAHSAAELPPIPTWNQQPVERSVPRNASLYIGFTRSWRILQQCVVSYITAGWPPEHIYVVENTGTMLSNKNHRLSLQNPFFLNHTRLEMLGVNVIITPTLLTFAQLQNFFLWNALSSGFEYYFWSHMDVAALAYEDAEERNGFKSLYDRGLDALEEMESSEEQPWGIAFFAYDHLTLVNTAAYDSIGAWDTHIPFYTTDCDFHFRVKGSGYRITTKEAGHVKDVADSLTDIEVLYRKKNAPPVDFKRPEAWLDILKKEEEIKKKDGATKKTRDTPVKTLDDLQVEHTNKSSADPGGSGINPINSGYWHDDDLNSQTYKNIVGTFDEMKTIKDRLPRLRWQTKQQGGEGEPYYRDTEGFDKGLAAMVDVGRVLFSEKWGQRNCALDESRKKPHDAWKLKHDDDFKEAASWGGLPDWAHEQLC